MPTEIETAIVSYTEAVEQRELAEYHALFGAAHEKYSELEEKTLAELRKAIAEYVDACTNTAINKLTIKILDVVRGRG